MYVHINIVVLSYLEEDPVYGPCLGLCLSLGILTLHRSTGLINTPSSYTERDTHKPVEDSSKEADAISTIFHFV